MADLRPIAAPFVALGPSGVAVRTRLGDLTPEDEKVLRLVGAHLGSLASKDLKARCAEGLEHSTAPVSDIHPPLPVFEVSKAATQRVPLIPPSSRRVEADLL